MRKIVLFGGSGILGKEIQKYNKEIHAPKKLFVNIHNREACKAYIESIMPEVVINCAAIKNNNDIESDPEEAIKTNIIGAANLASICFELDIRYVYISTDYVYKGDRGNYKETDEILPFNKYAWTKLGGECSAGLVKNHLIIRTSFYEAFKYNKVFIDKYSSKDSISVIAKMVYDASLSSVVGVLNVGTDRKTIHDSFKGVEGVKAIRLSESNIKTPQDTSLNLQKWINALEANPVCKTHDSCRCCGSSNMTKYLDLGVMPLANNLEFTTQLARNKERFPLQIMFCNDCSLSQLSVVINPKTMFSYYTYRSSINGGYVKHCREMAKQLKQKYNLGKDSFHIDIAGNDGALLMQFKEEIGGRVLNVDPAKNLTAIAEQMGVPSFSRFWNLRTANEILITHGKANLITATNVFAHVDNIMLFLRGAYDILEDKGVLILEFPYLVDFIEKKEYDTTYFEHLSYVSISPLNHLCNNLKLKIIDVEKQNIHGGTVRVAICKKESEYIPTESVGVYLKNEDKNGYNDIETYIKWSKQIKNTILDFTNKITNLKKQGYKIAAFAASAKGNTLLNSCNITAETIDYICDETPEKIGKYSPGTGIPILHKQEIGNNPPDYLVILAWNFADEIIEKLRPIYKGKYIIPVPEYKERD